MYCDEMTFHHVSGLVFEATEKEEHSKSERNSSWGKLKRKPITPLPI